jgi:hypothetical protein
VKLEGRNDKSIAFAFASKPVKPLTHLTPSKHTQ